MDQDKSVDEQLRNLQERTRNLEKRAEDVEAVLIKMTDVIENATTVQGLHHLRLAALERGHAIEETGDFHFKEEPSAQAILTKTDFPKYQGFTLADPNGIYNLIKDLEADGALDDYARDLKKLMELHRQVVGHPMPGEAGIFALPPVETDEDYQPDPMTRKREGTLLDLGNTEIIGEGGLASLAGVLANRGLPLEDKKPEQPKVTRVPLAFGTPKSQLAEDTAQAQEGHYDKSIRKLAEELDCSFEEASERFYGLEALDRIDCDCD